ncbi:MAG: substrate-binding domain-containing protein [Ruminococcus sp.]|nr:substrate-binding domain-containing protein [Ruminococcus sp.]
MKKRLLIGVVLTDCHVDFQEEVLKGIISQAFKSNCDIAVITTFHNFCYETPNRSMEARIFDLILSDRFAGFLCMKNTFRDDNIKQQLDELFLRAGKPVMLLDSDEHKNFESTAIDDRSAIEKITDHLIDVHGFNKIYCLTGPKNNFVSEERLAGFKNSMKNHGLYYDKSCCIYGDFWKDAARALAERIISGSLSRPEAIVCGNDFSAIALAEALASGGIRVPEDIAVTGYDASEEGKQFSPVITSYHRPYFQLGAEGFRRLYRIITGKITGRVHNKARGLRHGCSCGCKVQLTGEKTPRREVVNAALERDILYRDMLFDVTSAETPRELADSIDNYTYYIYKANRIFVCLTDSFMKLGSNSDRKLDFLPIENMHMILAKSAVKRLPGCEAPFPASSLLPDYDADRRYPVAYYLTPLSFKENFFGYTAVSFGKVPMSFNRIFRYWTNYINVTLEQMRIKSILNNTLSTTNRAMLHDAQTGLLNRAGVKKAYADQLGYMRGRGSTVNFIRIQLTGLNDAVYLNDEEKCIRIMRNFIAVLRELLRSDEIFGYWTAYTFAVITPFPDRCGEIFGGLQEALPKTAFEENESCNIDFTVGLHTQPVDSENPPSAALHKAAVNRVYSYTVSETAGNPQYEKLCILRGKLMKNPELPWNISEIAGRLYLSKSYLQKIYKTYFGKSIIEEMIFFRIEKAKELLDSTEMTVTEIARECGYSSYNYFVRQFKSAEGIAPSEYRRR